METSLGEEIKVIEKNKTWELSTLPKGHQAIGFKWIFKAKKNVKGVAERYEGKTLCKGYKKKYVFNYEVFAKNSAFHDQRKHIGIMFHFIGEYVDKKEIEPNYYVKTQVQVAYIFTKPVKFEDFRRLRARLSLKKKTSN